ncbi:MAG: fasciclin domain-containing protein [Prevotellaceae bacterium]|nr:fasciclin domain-containing protein [Prevotellaceae bacterium]
MKVIKLVFAAALTMGMVGCQNIWDEHYGEQDDNLNNSSVEVVPLKVEDFLKQSEELKDMVDLFEATGVMEDMTQKGQQLFTVLAVENGVDEPTVTDLSYFARSHVSDVALSPSNLKNGQRVLMWNGKYVEVSKMQLENGTEDIFFAGNRVKKVIRATNGYVYILDNYISAPQSMFEIISGLDENYSLFRDMVMSRNVKAFDKNASTPIGVDNTGATVYDSVFVVTNPYFTAAGLDLLSESNNATMLIPSNKVIEAAWEQAETNLKAWNMTRVDSIYKNWVFQASFFKENYGKEDFATNEDLTSIFSKQWRTTVQKVDLEHPIQMSNGVAYYVTELKIPTNVLIYRLKDFFYPYESLSAEEKATFYKEDGIYFNKCNTDVAAWSGWPGYFPNIINRVLMYEFDDQESANATGSLEFIPYHYDTHAVAYRIPAGEYTLSIGFKQKMAVAVDFYVDDEFLAKIPYTTGTTYHYDRGAGGYPEGFDLDKATDKKKSNYDRDGGAVGLITLTGEPASLTFRMEFTGTAKGGDIVLHHWCLKPTKNCY